MTLEPTEAWRRPVGDAARVHGLIAGGRRRRPVTVLLQLLLRAPRTRTALRLGSLLVLDLAGVAGGLYSALVLKSVLKGQGNIAQAGHTTGTWVWFTYLVTVLMFARADLYGDRTRRAGIRRVAIALSQVTVVCLIFALASGEHFVSYYTFYASLAIGTVFIAGLRELHLHLSAWALDRGGYRRRAILVGSGNHLASVARALSDRARTRVEIVGQVSSAKDASTGLRWLGAVEALPEVLAHEPVQEVIVADPACPAETAVGLVDLCHAHGVTVLAAPTTMDILMSRADFVSGQAVPLFTLRPPMFEGIDFALKRLVDVALAALALCLLAPVLAIIALAVKLTSSGPVIYRSVRPGIGGAPFDCLKFRTMQDCADQLQADLESLNEKSGAIFKIRDDPRVTGVGRILRRFSLDELPQLVNVLRGEMSMVGPRPLPMRDFEQLEEWHKQRYLVLPGITGLWQVSGRSDLDFDDLVRLDFLYLERWSVWLDLGILLRTIPAVIRRRGAF